MKTFLTLLLALTPCLTQPHNKSLENSIGMQLVFITAGSFTMGSPYENEMRQDDEKPHNVIIERGFYMSATEVTQAQWTAVMGHNKSFHKGDSLPAEKMSWKEAVVFCEKLSEREGKTYRLPTEAKWEYACRAGEESPSMDQLGDTAWYAMNSGGRTQPVAQKQPNAWGLYDLLGNISEWCADGYVADYAADADTIAQSRSKVIRGGAFDSFPPACRAAARTSGPAAYKYAQTGFRVVLEITH
jgi:formylglycine-generating enzyme required for sulfatase activity